MHNSLPLLLLPRNPDDLDGAQDRLPDDPPVDEEGRPEEDLPDGRDGGDGKGGGKEGDDKDDDGGGRKEYRAGNCNDCNRQFCLDYNLPICKGAGMEDVFTTCFREFFAPLFEGGVSWGLLMEMVEVMGRNGDGECVRVDLVG